MSTITGSGVGFTYWLNVNNYLLETGHSELPSEIRDSLDEQANEQFYKGASEGYHSGQLLCSFWDSDNEIDYDFEGWWKAN